jgi:N,N'-diacetyllegionaminate synthase
MRKLATIEGKKIGDGQPVYVIAEIGGNFSDFETAKKLVDLAKESGADAVKLQNYEADTITSKKAVFEMENTGKVSQWELFRKYEIGRELTRAVFDYCAKQKITVFSTPSHPKDIDLLEELGVCAHKIGSDDAVNLPFLKYAARTGKPLLMSTGMCTMSEVVRSVDAILEEGCENLVLFHCTSNYPTHPASVNLLAMKRMLDTLGLPVGYSDHTLGIDTCYTAAVLGAHTLEFHFTYDKNAPGPDHMLSKTPQETRELVAKVRQLPILLGDGVKRPATTEMTSRKNNRKSVVVTRNVKAGEKLGPKNIEIKRPGYGIPCEFFYSLLGKTATRDLGADEVLSWDDVV